MGKRRARPPTQIHSAGSSAPHQRGQLYCAALNLQFYFLKQGDLSDLDLLCRPGWP